MPQKRPRDKLGTSQGHPGRLADLCGNSNSRGRMSAGQTGQMPRQTGHVHVTDGTHTKGCPAKILYVYWFVISPISGRNSRKILERPGNALRAFPGIPLGIPQAL